MEISPDKQVMKLNDKHLLLDSVSEEFITMLRELNSVISEKVSSIGHMTFHYWSLLPKRTVSLEGVGATKFEVLLCCLE